MLFATGLDPDRSTVFAQSHVTAHAEAAWLLSAVTSYGQLGRMTQFKDKGERQEFVSAGALHVPGADGGRHPPLPDRHRPDRRRPAAAPRARPRRRRAVQLALRRDVRRAARRLPRGRRAGSWTSRSRPKKMSTTGGTPQGTVLIVDAPDVIRKKFKIGRHRLRPRGAPRDGQARDHEPDRDHVRRRPARRPRRSRRSSTAAATASSRRRSARRWSRSLAPIQERYRRAAGGRGRAAAAARDRRREGARGVGADAGGDVRAHGIHPLA